MSALGTGTVQKRGQLPLDSSSGRRLYAGFRSEPTGHYRFAAIAVLVGDRSPGFHQILQHGQQNCGQVGPLGPAAVRPMAADEAGDTIDGATSGLRKLVG